MDVQDQKIYTALVVAAIVIASIVAYFFFSLIRQHKNVVALQRRNATAEITGIEKDRSRIAADLHDELAPMLVAVRMRINSFDLYNESDQKHLLVANQTIDDIARRMRSISYNLMPATLEQKGLVSTLQEFISMTNDKSGLRILLQNEAGELALGLEKEIHVYRVLQEIIHNTLKHAGASELLIVLRSEKDWFIAATRDNGRGFEYKQTIGKGSGLGMRSILNRVSLLKGEFMIDSKVGLGTAITIKIPKTDE